MSSDKLTGRNIVHITMSGFALLIGRIPPWAIVLLCLLALLFNLFVLPVLTRRSLEKPEDKERGYSVGLLTYPAILLLISVIFYSHQVYLAIGWGMMAFGDGFASLVGRRKGRVFWYGGPKTLEGTLAFFVAATHLTMGLLLLLPAATTSFLSGQEWLFVVTTVAAITAVAEMTPGFFDDNLSVPLLGSLLSFTTVQLLREGIFSWPEPAWTGPLIVLAFGVRSYLGRVIDLKGAIAGMLIALSIRLGAGLEGLLLLFVFFIAGSLAGFAGRQAKLATGRGDFRSTSRGWRNAVSNGGAAALAGVMAWGLPGEANMFLAALAGSLASACSDTLSSELGTPYGRRHFDLMTLRRTVPGNDGVISPVGLLAGLGGAALVAGLSWFLLPARGFVLAVGIAGFAGNLLDSLLGATLQRRGFMNNHSVNLASTLLAAFIAAAIYSTA